MSEATVTATRSHAGNTAVFVLVGVAALLMAIFILGVAMGAQGWDTAILFLALATTFVGAFPIVFDAGRPPEKRQFLISLLALSYMVYIVIPVFSNYFALKGEDPKGMFNVAEMAPTDVATAQVAALAGLLSIIIGFYSPFGRFAVAPIPRPTREWSSNATVVVALIMLGLGWIVFLARNLGLIPPEAGSGALGVVSMGAYWGLALLALCWLRHRTRIVLPILLVVVPLATFLSFFTGSKRQTLTPLFVIALAYMVYERRIRKSWVVGGIALLIVLYPVSQFYRATVSAEQGRMQTFLRDPAGTLGNLAQFGGESVGTDYLASGLLSTARRLDGLGVFATILRETPERVPFQGGWTLAMIPISYVPRFIWHDKPPTTIGRFVQTSYGAPGDEETNVGPTWMGELYFNFGYPGILVGMFVLGVWCRMLHERLFSPTATIPALLCAVIAIYGVTRSIMSAVMGPINGIVFNGAFIAFLHVVVGLFAGWMTSQQRHAAPSPRPS